MDKLEGKYEKLKKQIKVLKRGAKWVDNFNDENIK